MLIFVHNIDAPYNCFPSQHVAYSWLGAFIALKFNPLIGIFVTIAAILISLSTMFIKQHWFVDVLSGIAVALFVYWVFFIKFRTKISGEN
jgi:membrane-associated phospholipid phosphatase